MYKLGCYVSENDILSALSVMIVYFAIHHILFEYIPLCYHLTCKRKNNFKNSEQTTLAERTHRDSGVLTTLQLFLGHHGHRSFLLFPAPEAIGVAPLSMEFHGGETHSWKPFSLPCCASIFFSWAVCCGKHSVSILHSFFLWLYKTPLFQCCTIYSHILLSMGISVIANILQLQTMLQ